MEGIYMANQAREIKFIAEFTSISMQLLHFPLCQSMHFINYSDYAEPVLWIFPSLASKRHTHTVNNKQQQQHKIIATL